MSKLVLLFIVSSFLACSTQSQSQSRLDAKYFPDKSEIELLIREESPDPFLNTVPGKIVDSWKLVEPLPTIIGDTIASPKSHAEDILHESIEGTNIKMTDSMNCVARQYSAFFSVHKKTPFGSLARFINARCGSLNQGTSFRYIRVSKTISRADLSDLTQTFLRPFEREGDWNFGVFLSKGEEYRLNFAAEASQFQIEPIPMFVKNGTFSFRGKYKNKDAEGFGARFNIGDFSVGTCEEQPEKPPAFHFICRTDSKDPFTYVEVGVSEKDAIYQSYLGSFMVFSQPLNAYLPPKSRQILQAASKKGNGLDHVEELINRVRNSAGRKSLRVEEEQSKVIKGLLPAFIAQNHKKRSETLLGMLAGWEVKGEIIDTSYRAGHVDGTDSVTLLEAVLESPGGRETLLGLNASSVALGRISEAKKGTQFMFVTYSFLKDEHINKRISRVMKGLRRKRKKQGSGVTKELTQFRVDAEKWAQEFRDGATFESIEEKMVQTYFSKVGSASLRYNSFSVSDLDNIHFSRRAITDKNIHIIMTVTPYRPKNSPRTFYAVFYVYKSKP